MYAAYGCIEETEPLDHDGDGAAAEVAAGAGAVGSCPGSTKLHMDMSDAVNVLVHVAPSRGGGGSGSGGGGGSAHAVASCRDEVSGGEGDWLSRQRGTGVESVASGLVAVLP